MFKNTNDENGNKNLELILHNEDFDQCFSLPEYFTIDIFKKNNIPHLVKTFGKGTFIYVNLRFAINKMCELLEINNQTGYGFCLIVCKEFIFIAPIKEPFTFTKEQKEEKSKTEGDAGACRKDRKQRCHAGPVDPKGPHQRMAQGNIREPFPQKTKGKNAQSGRAHEKQIQFRQGGLAVYRSRRSDDGHVHRYAGEQAKGVEQNQIAEHERGLLSYFLLSFIWSKGKNNRAEL